MFWTTLIVSVDVKQKLQVNFVLFSIILQPCFHVLQGEGISYRGRILMSIECFEGEPDETGTSMVEDTPPLPKVLHAFFDPHVECVSSSSFMVLPLFMYVVQSYCYVV